MFTASTQVTYSTPVPLPEDPAGNIKDECRLWIGNLDQRLTEFALLKLLQKFGNLKRFDFLINKQGPDKGKPRGYCFVSYETREDAERAMKKLHGKTALSKKFVVRWANAETESEQIESKQGPSSGNHGIVSTDSKIRAIEAQLQRMENTSQEFTLTSEPAAPPGSSQLYQLNSTKQQQTKKPYCRKK